MTFEIGHEIVAESNGYYVKVEFMFGDADGFEESIVGPFTDTKLLEMFLTMLEKCQDNRYERFNIEYWSELVPEAAFWIVEDDDNYSEEDFRSYFKEYGFKNKYDNYDLPLLKCQNDYLLNGDCLAAIRSYGVYYVKDGTRYTVNVIKEEV